MCSAVSSNDLSTPYDTFPCFWSGLEQGYGGPSYLSPTPPPPRDVTWAKLTVILRRLGRPDTGCFEQKHKRTTTPQDSETLWKYHWSSASVISVRPDSPSLPLQRASWHLLSLIWLFLFDLRPQFDLWGFTTQYLLIMKHFSPTDPKPLKRE